MRRARAAAWSRSTTSSGPGRAATRSSTSSPRDTPSSPSTAKRSTPPPARSSSSAIPRSDAARSPATPTPSSSWSAGCRGNRFAPPLGGLARGRAAPRSGRAGPRRRDSRARAFRPPGEPERSLQPGLFRVACGSARRGPHPPRRGDRRRPSLPRLGAVGRGFRSDPQRPALPELGDGVRRNGATRDQPRLPRRLEGGLRRPEGRARRVPG